MPKRFNIVAWDIEESLPEMLCNKWEHNLNNAIQTLNKAEKDGANRGYILDHKSHIPKIISSIA